MMLSALDSWASGWVGKDVNVGEELVFKKVDGG